MAIISGKDKDSIDIKKYYDYISGDRLLKSAFYPYSNETSTGEFLIEDYFSAEKISQIIDSLINGEKHPVKNLSNLSKRVKDTLADKFRDYPKEDFEGFKPLLNKIVELISL